MKGGRRGEKKVVKSGLIFLGTRPGRHEDHLSYNVT